MCIYVFFCFKQKTAYEMRISDWSSDVCSSDLSLALVDQVACIPDTLIKDEHGQKIRDSSARYDTIAREYVELPVHDQAETLIVTGTNASRTAERRVGKECDSTCRSRRSPYQ